MSVDTSARAVARAAARKAGYLLVALSAPAWRRGRERGSIERPERILVVRLDLLGDVLFSMQAVAGLRQQYPDAHIAMLTLPYTAPLARRYSAVDRVFSVDSNRIRRPRGLLSPATWLEYRRMILALRRERFDLAISLSGPMASLWAALSDAHRVIGFGDEGYPRMLTAPLNNARYAERKHEVEYVRDLARAAGAVSFPSNLQVPREERTRVRVEKLLESRGLADARPLVLIHAGATNGSAKRWPTHYWAGFADALHTRTGAAVALVGARGDRQIADEVLSAARTQVKTLVGETTIEELIELLARADLVATGDSGPLHLAVALGTPLLGVYGPTDPEVHGPFNPAGPTRIHRRDLVCSPCYSMARTAECPLGDPICMRLVTVEDMVESAVALLSP